MPRYEFVEGTSSKFWEITLEDTSFTTTYGKIGTSGQSTTKTFGDAASAKKEHDKLVAEKTKKGYVLVGGAPAAAAPAPAAAPAAKAGKKKAEEAPAPAPAPAPASGAQRYELVEGSSSKFWEITLAGSSFTTTYGKIGTSGQSTTKNFADEAAAKKEHDKLVAEKTKKGYLLASGAGAGAPAGGGGGGGAGGVVHAKAGTAFRMGDLEQLDGRPNDHAETFLGMKVAEFGGGEDDDGDDDEGGGSGLKNAAKRAWRVSIGDDGGDWQEKFDKLCADPNAGKVKALIVGMWDEEMGAGEDGGSMVEAICAAKGRLTSLAALFLNDVQPEECEVSWLNLREVSPILAAYPKLEHLRVRGNASGEKMGKLKSTALRSLQLEGSNLARNIVQQVASADLPNLEHLELWLGPADYAEAKPLEDFVPILSGKLFPKLKYLGLRNSDQADSVAQAVATAPIVERLDTVDLSLGNLGDAGAEALIASPSIARLKTLDVRHHYISAPVLKRLKALKPVKVKESRSENEDEDEGVEDARRYVAVGE